MENIKIATAQFENKSNDKNHNLSIIDKLSKQAAIQEAKNDRFSRVLNYRLHICT